VTSVLPRVLRRDPLATVVLLDCDCEVARWPLEGVDAPDLWAVDVLCHLALTARRLGCDLRLLEVDAELARLLVLCGLGEVVGLPRQVVGEAEHREQVGAQEVVVPDDPVA
jgi:ABC-type transporter Mla MlaB component